MPIPLIVDSGIGDNIDDAFALALACCSPGLDLIGVTTAGHHPDLRAVLARRLLGSYGRTDVPVAIGQEPTSHPDHPPARGLVGGRLTRERDPLAPLASEDAAGFIASTIAHRPGTVIAATGALSNIAAAITRYPRVERLIERVVFAAGWPAHALPEYNIVQDSKAVATLLKSRVPLTFLEDEVTRDSLLRSQHLLQLETSSGRGPAFLSSIFQDWRLTHPSQRPMMQDPLTVALLARPDLVRVAGVQVVLETEPGPRYGTLYVVGAGGRPVQRCASVDSPRYLQHLMDCVAPLAPGTEPDLNADKWHVEVKGVYRLEYYPGWRLDRYQDDCHTLGFVVDGECLAEVEGSRFQARSGSMLYFPPNQEYGLSSRTGFSIYWIYLDIKVYEGGLAPFKLPRIAGLPPCVELGAKVAVLHTHAERIFEYWKRPWPEDALQCKASVYEMLGALSALGHQHLEKTWSDRQVAVSRAKRYIEEHLEAQIDLDEIARHVGMSKFHLARHFTAEFGVSPLRYHLLRKIDHAKLLLRLHHLSVEDVAARLGYSSVSAFTRAFTRVAGMSPTEYRK